MSKVVPEEGEALRYTYLLNKLYATLVRYNEEFPELTSLGKDLDYLVNNQHSEMNYYQKLIAIQLLLKEKSISSYVVRHIYHNFGQEVVLFKAGTIFTEDTPFYLQIP